MPPPRNGRGPAGFEIACVAALATVLFATFAWPWVRSMATSIPDAAVTGNPAWGADARLIAWALAWVAHSLVTAPSRLFDANIFHPIPRMLTGSEHFMSSVLVSGPVYALSGNPILAANVATMSTYVLAVVVAYALMRELELPAVAAGVAAAAFALGPLEVPADLHALQCPTWYLALVLLTAVRVGHGGRHLWVAVAVTLAVFSSYYIAAMTAALMGVEALLACRTRGWRAALRLLVATLPGFGLLALFSLPYLHAPTNRPPASAVDPLSAAVRWAWGRIFDPGNLYPGIGWGLVVLAGAGLLVPFVQRQRPTLRWWRWLILVALGSTLAAPFVVTVGSMKMPLPSALLLPVHLRANFRLILLAYLGLVGLAAEGTAALGLWLARRGKLPWGGRAFLAAALMALVTVPRARHLADQPLTALPTGPDVPPVYRWLADNARGPLLEPPGPDIGNWLAQADSMVLSTYHWLPLLNGHTGFPPWAYRAMTPEFGRLPARDALQTLVDLTDLEWVLVRRDRVPPAYFAAWQTFAQREGSVQRVAAGDPDLLLRVTLRPRHEWAAALARVRTPPGQTVLGTSLAPLDEAAVRGQITAIAQPRMRAGTKAIVAVRVENGGVQTWPVLVPPWSPEAGVVRLVMRWHASNGALVSETTDDIPRDVAPGDVVRFPTTVAVPATPGAYTLAFAVTQVEGAAMHGVVSEPIPILVSDAAP